MSPACNKTFGDCKKWGNAHRFGGLRLGLCPYIFGDKDCGIGKMDTLNVGTRIGGLPPSKNWTGTVFRIIPNSNGVAIVELVPDRGGLRKHTLSYLEELLRKGTLQILTDTFEEPTVIHKGAPVFMSAPDCDECWGTGYYKGYGGPCFKGCKPC